MTAAFDEADAVAELKALSKRTEGLTSAEVSRATFREDIHRLLAEGNMSYSEALRMVSASHEDVDIALREHMAGYIVAGLPVPEELRHYAAVALFHAPVTYPGGNVPLDDLARNFNVVVLVEAALARWPHLKLTRNRDSKRPRPSVCSLVAKALDMGEERVVQIVGEHRKGKVARKIAAL